MYTFSINPNGTATHLHPAALSVRWTDGLSMPVEVNRRDTAIVLACEFAGHYDLDFYVLDADSDPIYCALSDLAESHTAQPQDEAA